MFFKVENNLFKKSLLFFIFTCSVAYSFYDEELIRLWSSIPDISNPSLQDYRSIENYLNSGKRPYLDVLRRSVEEMGDLKRFYLERMNRIVNFKLVGANNEMPVFEVHRFHVEESAMRRCVLLYSSFNGVYPEKARKILSELRQSGYRGHVLLRIGGFPNIANGGLKLCHVPYAFKVAFFREAQLLGYKEILWIDSAIHPISNLEAIFKEISERGYFFTTVGTLKDNLISHLPEAAQSLGIGMELYDRIPHIASGLIGLNVENFQAMQLLNDWYCETEKVYPNMTWFPEELSLSVSAWRLDCLPYSWFGNLVCADHELLQLLSKRPLHFYIDSVR